MSAFMCDAKHLSACADILVVLGQACGTAKMGLEAGETAPQLFHVLMTENARSLEARYPADWTECLEEGSLDAYHYIPQAIPDLGSYGVSVDDLAAALKAIGCYGYQSCEHNDWKESRAFAMVTNAERFLSDRLAMAHPAYEKAAWGWEPNAIPKLSLRERVQARSRK